jgi:hypothetical protein
MKLPRSCKPPGLEVVPRPPVRQPATDEAHHPSRATTICVRRGAVNPGRRVAS